jgi:hypothetical protein
MYHCRWLPLAGVMNCYVLESKAYSVLSGYPYGEIEYPVESGVFVSKSSTTPQKELEAIVKATDETLWEMEDDWKTTKYIQGKAQCDIENAFASLGHHRVGQKRVTADTQYEMQMIAIGGGAYDPMSTRIEGEGYHTFKDDQVVYGPLTLAETIMVETKAKL